MQQIKIKDLGTEPLDDATLVSSMSMLTAIQVHKSGDVGRAASIYANVLKHNAESSDAACLLGVAAYDNGIYDEAELLMRRATELDPTNPDYQLQIGRVYNKQGKKDLALEAFSKSIVSAPRPDAFIDMGDMAMSESKYDQAENCYKQAISMAPDEHSYYYKLADFYQKRKKIDLAIETWGIALTYATDDNYQRFMLVRLCLQNNYNRQALEHISVLIKNKDDLTPQVQLLLAPICNNLEDYEGAAILWQAVINRTPQRTDLYLKVGDSYQKINKHEEAITAYRLYLDEYDYAPEVYKKIAQPLFSLDHKNEAFECMRIAIDQSNHHAEFFITLATMYQELKEYNKSLSVLYEAQKYNPKNVKVQTLITFFNQLINKQEEDKNKVESAPIKEIAEVPAKRVVKAKLKPHGKPNGTRMKQSAKADIYDLLLSQVNNSDTDIEKPKARANPKPKPKRRMTKKQASAQKQKLQKQLQEKNPPKKQPLKRSKKPLENIVLDSNVSNIEPPQPTKKHPSQKDKKSKAFKTSGKKTNGLNLDALKDILQDKTESEKQQQPIPYQNFKITEPADTRERPTMDLSNKTKATKQQEHTLPRKVVNKAYDHNNPQGYTGEGY